MTEFKKSIPGYKIIFLYNENLLKIYVQDKISKGKNKIKFINITLNLDDKLRKYFSDFKELIKQIKEKNISIRIDSDKNIKTKYYFKLIKKEKNKEIISERIYTLNVEYYFINGATYKKLNSKPFLSYLRNDNFNINDILNLIDNENILSSYIIDDIKYFDKEKKVFKTLSNQNNIYFGEKLILHFHIRKLNKIYLTNLKSHFNYFDKEIKKIVNQFEKRSDINQKYDLIYLYASPIITDNNFSESESPISYMEEIRTILKLMEKKNKKFKCKFECMGEDSLRDILTNYKTKILHLSAHGKYDGDYAGKYSLLIENLKQNGQCQLLNIEKLKLLLEPCKNNLRQIELVIVSTCYSEYLSNLFLEYGAKNVIYIDKEVEIMNRISVFFVKFFYFFLLEGNSIKESYDKAINIMKIDKEVIHLNSNGCCCNHYHKNECKFKGVSEKKKIHENFHSFKSEYCHCKQEESHYHYDNCDYIKKILESYQKDMKEIKKKDDLNIICCCDTNIKHNEITKTLYKSAVGKNGNIFPFKYKERGKTFVNSQLKLNFDGNKFDYIVGRKNIIGRIFDKINNEKFIILFGEKDLAKMNFSESLCEYLHERKIINDYKIFRIKNEWDFNFIKDKIFYPKIDNSFKSCRKKNVVIIRFDIEEDTIGFKLFSEIFTKFYNNCINQFFFIFIFNTKDSNEMIDRKDKEEKFWTKMKNNIDKNIKEDINKYIYYIGININLSLNVINNFLKGKNIKISDNVKENLIREKAKYKPKKIKILSELLLQDETPENIKKMKELKLTNIKLSSNELSYKLYYLLMNMPSGLPDCFLQLIFPDYDKINDNNNLMRKSIDNWNIINKEKIIEKNFKDINKMKLCYISLFEALKIYAQLLKFYIDKNREKIIYKNGEIHYIFNSYSNENIWKSQIPNKFRNIINKNNLNQDYNIKKHLENILYLIDFIISNINSFSIINEIKEEFDKYLNEILLLFSSYFFLKNDNIKYIYKCIELSNKLLKKRGKKFELLNQKLLLFLYSVDENKNEILKLKNNKTIDKNLKIELDFLECLRNSNKNIEGFNNLLDNNISDEMKFNKYREIAIYNYKRCKYDQCFENLENALKIKNINALFKQRIIIDSCFNLKKLEGKKLNSIMKKYKKTKDKLFKEKINQLNEIIECPLKKNLYYESHIIRDDINNLFKPYIVMLNSNPLKKISNYSNQINNQFFILKELQKSLNSSIGIKSYVLNEQNLKKALNGSGKILIIQSDDFSLDGDIVCESENGESYVFTKENLCKLIKDNFLFYYLIILCFPKSSKLKKYLDLNRCDYQDIYWITFEDFDDSKVNNLFMQEFNKSSIQFLIDFIIYFVENNNDMKIANIFKEVKKKFIDDMKSKNLDILCKNYIILSNRSSRYSSIEFQLEHDDNGIFLYDDLPKFDDFDYNLDYNNLSLKIYDLIKKIKKENKLIFCPHEAIKKLNLKICFEIMKYFYRHKTYFELYYIDIRKDGKTFLKSLVRKLKKIRNIESEDSEDEDGEEKIEPRKACLILIDNCTSQDMLDVNIYSILDSNSSFIIIFDKQKKNFEEQNPLLKESILVQEDNIHKSINDIQKSDNSESNETEIKYKPNELTSSNIITSININSIILSYSDFEIIQTIGKSNFANIYKVRYKLNGNIYALKLYDKTKANDEHELNYYREKEILYDLTKRNHPKIVKLYSDFEENNKAYLVMEYIEGTTLKNFRKNSIMGYIPQREVINILAQILQVLEFLHDECHIIHRDIRPDNIIIQKGGNIKLIDFGISAYLENSNKRLVSNKSFKGERNYVAPEIILFPPPLNYDYKIDIFSLGLTMYNFMNPSLNEFGNLPIITKIKFGYFTRIEQNIEKNEYEPWLNNFVKRLYENNPINRPTAKQALDLLKKYQNEPNLKQNFYDLKSKKSNLENINILFKRDNYLKDNNASNLNSVINKSLPSQQMENTIISNTIKFNDSLVISGGLENNASNYKEYYNTSSFDNNLNNNNEIDKKNFIFKLNNISIPLTVSNNTIILDLIKLYLMKNSIPLSDINNYFFLYNAVNIGKYIEQPVSDIFKYQTIYRVIVTERMNLMGA